jgi:hypothetical protein
VLAARAGGCCDVDVDATGLLGRRRFDGGESVSSSLTHNATNSIKLTIQLASVHSAGDGTLLNFTIRAFLIGTMICSARRPLGTNKL